LDLWANKKVSGQYKSAIMHLVLYIFYINRAKPVANWFRMWKVPSSNLTMSCRTQTNRHPVASLLHAQHSNCLHVANGVGHSRSAPSIHLHTIVSWLRDVHALGLPRMGLARCEQTYFGDIII